MLFHFFLVINFKIFIIICLIVISNFKHPHLEIKIYVNSPFFITTNYFLDLNFQILNKLFKIISFILIINPFLNLHFFI